MMGRATEQPVISCADHVNTVYMQTCSMHACEHVPTD